MKKLRKNHVIAKPAHTAGVGPLPKISKELLIASNLKKPTKAAFFKAAFIGLRIERKSNSCLRITMAILYPGGNQL